MSLAFMSSVSMTITLGRFCCLFSWRSLASFSRCAWQAFPHLAACAGDGAAQRSSAALSAASRNAARCGLPESIETETRNTLGRCGPYPPGRQSPSPIGSRFLRALASKGSEKLMAISKVGVLGCGLMGHGISQICAQQGWDVVVREIDQAQLDKGMAKIEKQLARAVGKGKMEQSDADAVRGRITTTLDYSDLADCDLVIEAITEDLDRKLEMWRELDEIVKDDALLATNTSSLPVATQADATKRPER